MIGNFLLGLLFFIVIASTGKVMPQLTSEGRAVVKQERRYQIFEPTSSSFLSLGKASLEKEIPPPPSLKPFPRLSLEAKSVYVFDLVEGKALLEKDADRPSPLASVSKLMTALLLEEKGGPIGLISISREAIRQEGDDGFRAGEEFKGGDLRDFMLVGSSNDAAYAIAEFIGKGLEGGERASVSKFVALMNERVRELGMTNSSFLNSHGLDATVNLERISGAEGTAHDAALLIKYIYENHSEILEETRNGELEIRSSEGRRVKTQNTNDALGAIPQLIGAKTGFTELAGGNLVFIFDAGFSRPIVVSILGSSREGRFEDAKKIVDAVFTFYLTMDI